MTGLRVVLVSRRFWPQTGWPETNMARLAVGLHRHGAQVTIVSARWDGRWPDVSDFQGLPLIRLNNPGPGMWGSLCYARALARWLRENRKEIDLVCVSRLRVDAYAALGALKRSLLPVVLRVDMAGPLGDCRWQQRKSFGRRIRRRCRSASAIVAPDGPAADELQSAGYRRERIHVISNGIPAVPCASGGDRFDARLALAAANQDLTVANDAAVVVFAGPLRTENRLFLLLEAWQIVRTHRPDAKLWLFGDGPLRSDLYDRIGDLDLRSHVYLPGSIDELDGVWHAANLIVHPASPSVPSQMILEGIAAGVPVLASAPVGANEMSRFDLEQSETQFTPATLAEAMLERLDHPPTRESLQLARRKVLAEHSLTNMCRRHLLLFQRLCQRPG